MPRYAKSYRRQTRSRFYRKRTLSNRRVYGNTSARAQASQIATLRNRINKVYRACKPEKKVVISDSALQFAMGSGTGMNTYFNSGVLDIGNGAGDSDRIGDKIYRRDYYYLTFEYYNTSNTGYHDSESSGTPVRIILGAFKNDQNAGSVVPQPSAIISNYDSTGPGSSASCISPLVNGVTDEHQIFYDKAFYLTADKNQKIIKLKTPWYLCRFGPSANYCNHSWLLCKASGLHWDTDFNEKVLVTLTRKTVFTDA